MICRKQRRDESDAAKASEAKPLAHEPWQDEAETDEADPYGLRPGCSKASQPERHETDA